MEHSSFVEISAIKNFITRIIDNRYPDLGEHQARIENNAVLFAQFVKLSHQDTESLRIGAGIHDIGKILISDYILNKPARLSANEFLLVKQHPEYGYNLLGSLKLTKNITEIVLYHHENYDGSGYPSGISGNGIPLLARMTRILDSFDALTMDRPYHKGVSSEEALNIIQQEERYYDPSLLESFIKVVHDTLTPKGKPSIVV